MRILVVEDDPSLAALLEKGLTSHGHTVELAHDGWTGLERAGANAHDAVVLDVMLPGIDGVEIASELRREGNPVPILMLTARDALDERLRGFDAGADDYLAKPFAMEELLARLQAVARRRVDAPVQNGPLIVGDLELDPQAREVHRGGTAIDLSPREFELLEYLMRNPGRALSRTLILEHVWDSGYDSFANVVDATIRRLRKAVDDPFDRPLIHTVRGVGYKLKP